MRLIPTPRTDKNGVTVIRHMKPKLHALASRKPLPTAPSAIQNPKKAPTEVGLSNKEIIDLIKHSSIC